MQRSLALILLFVFLAPWAQAQDIVTGLTLWYKLDDGSGTAPVDSSGNARTGTLGGTANWLTAGSCKVAGCLRLVAANSNVVTQAANLVTTLMTNDNGTMAAWVNPHGTPSASGVTTSLPGVIGDASGFAGIHRGNRTAGGDNFYFYLWDSAEKSFAVTYTVDTWVHLVWVRTGNPTNTLTAYKNGVIDGTPLTTAPIGGGGTTVIGKSTTGTNFLEADLDEVRVYNRALTAADVAALFAFPVAGGNRWRMMQRTTLLKTVSAWLWPGGLRVARTPR
jgi:large repetitive protein